MVRLILFLGLAFLARTSLAKPSLFVQTTGIHMDPHYQADSPATCVLGLLGLPCCRPWSKPPKTFDLIPTAGTFGNMGCDSPPILFHKTFETIGKMKPDFLLEMGDRVGHHLLNQSFPKAIQTIQFTSTWIREALGSSSPAYMTLGNHDTWPIDQWPDKPFTQNLTLPFGKAFFSNQTIPQSFLEGGYYSRRLAYPTDPPVRLVVLNTLWDDALNLMTLKEGPANQRTWLNRTLAEAKAKKEVVWLMAHVYPTSNEAKADWSDFFDSMIKLYASTVRYIFFGHTHLDDFLLFSTKTHVGWMPGSVTPFRDHMPSFRVYEWDPLSGTILDYVQWRATLGETDLVFKSIYRATEAFGLKGMEGKDWYGFWKEMKTNKTLFQQWWTYHGTGNPSLGPCGKACQEKTLKERYLLHT